MHGKPLPGTASIQENPQVHILLEDWMLDGVEQAVSSKIQYPEIYDDTMVLPDPVESVGSIITTDEVDVLEKLNSVLEPIIDELGDQPDGAYLAHPSWNAVVSAAADAVQVLERNDGHPQV